jgi:hypothetical protein
MDHTEAKSERQFLGVVEVDSGTLLVGDPLYCLPQAERERPGIDYQQVIDAEPGYGSYLGGQPVILLGGFGGDGTFPVYAELDEYGEVARVPIEFLGPAEDEDENEDDGETE